MKAPECMIIDMDPTVNRVYGDQQLALFNAHYDEYCLMPFHVYEGITGRLIATVLRPGKTPTKEEILALLKRIVRRIRARFVVTDLEGVGAKVIYETLYCDRGNAELMIKEHKCFLQSSRTRCTTAEANPFRLFLHSAAYVIMHGLRETVLKGTGMATAKFDTIRLRLLKVAARVQTGRTGHQAAAA